MSLISLGCNESKGITLSRNLLCIDSIIGLGLNTDFNDSVERWAPVNSVEQWSTIMPINNGYLKVFQGLFWHRLQIYIAQYPYSRVFMKERIINELYIKVDDLYVFRRNPFHIDGIIDHCLRSYCAETGSSMAFRTTDCRTKGSVDGHHVIYENPERIDSEMQRAVAFCRDISDQNYQIACIILYGLILRIHPFADGNGRFSRCLLNRFMSFIPQRRVYIPVSHFTALSRGGIQLSLREAQMNNDWEGFINHMLTAIYISSLPIVNYESKHFAEAFRNLLLSGTTLQMCMSNSTMAHG